MDKKHYDEHWTKLKRESRFNSLTNFILAIVVVVLSFRVMTEDVVTVIEPNRLKDAVQVSRDNMDLSYGRQFAWIVTEAIGNANEDNIRFLREVLSPMLSVQIRRQTLDQLEEEIVDLADNRTTYHFEPERIVEESNSEGRQRFVVEGTRHQTVAGQREHGRAFQYTIQLETRNYQPLITGIHAEALE